MEDSVWPQETWRPIDPDKRGRHKTFASALDVVAAEMLRERNSFFDSLPDVWDRLFPGLPVRPGRYEDGKIFLYVKNAPTSFMIRPKLPMIKKRLSELPNAPKRIDLRLEIK